MMNKFKLRKEQKFFCRFIKKIYASETEKQRRDKFFSIIADHRDGVVADFWQKMYLPFPPQFGMSVNTIAYSLRKNSKAEYDAVRFNPEAPDEHVVFFDSGKIESIKWGRYDGGIISENGTFICEVEPYKFVKLNHTKCQKKTRWDQLQRILFMKAGDPLTKR